MNETMHEYIMENHTQIITGNLEVEIEEKVVCKIELLNRWINKKVKDKVVPVIN
jgi:hypothetical protein